MDMLTTLIIFAAGAVLSFVFFMWKSGSRNTDNAQQEQMQNLLAEINRQQSELAGRMTSFAEAQEAARGQLNRNLAERLDTVSKNVGENLKQTGDNTEKTLKALGKDWPRLTVRKAR